LLPLTKNRHGLVVEAELGLATATIAGQSEETVARSKEGAILSGEAIVRWIG
jgi:hypothetical protein